MHPKMKVAKNMREKVIKLKLKMAKKTLSKPFEMEELEKIFKTQKSGKARDPSGIYRDIFKPSIIGYNLKLSLLVLCNDIKKQGKVPNFMLQTTISTIPKKGSQTELKNETGIFLVNSVRSLLMRLLFNSESAMVDKNMSESNIGGRKNKSCVNNIWVINSIIHEQLSSKTNKPLLFQQYDYQQMLNSMNLKEACGDFYDFGLTRKFKSELKHHQSSHKK